MIHPNGSPQHPVRLLGLGGSTRQGSLSLVGLQAALRIAEKAGAEIVLADVRQLDLPVYRADWAVTDYPPTLAWLLDEVRRADGFIFASPTYHGTISGAVKNVLDALNFLSGDQPRYLGGKPVGLMAFGGPGAVNVINALNHTTRGLNGLAATTTVTFSRGVIDPDWGDITDEAVRNRLQTMTAEVINLAQRLRSDVGSRVTV